MNRNIKVASVLGIPVIVNLSWLLTLGFITTLLATSYYPALFPEFSRYRDDQFIHWLMALASGLIFFASILLHELAHSLVARKQGIPVKSITLFVFGGVSQIGGEAKRPLYEFVMAIVGPLTSLLLGAAFFGIGWALGLADDEPVSMVLGWLVLMNLVVAVFNMAPGFPMDGGRVLRSVAWGLSGNFIRATHVATFVGRVLGYALIVVGALAIIQVITFIDTWSGAWFAILGLFLESSASQSWLQARAVDELTKHHAADIMSTDLETAEGYERVRYLRNRGGPRFIFFISDKEDEVAGVLTEKELEPLTEDQTLTTTAADLMRPTQDVPVGSLTEDGASLLERMEGDAVWHLPIVSEGRVVGVVSKESLLRLMARSIFPRVRPPEPNR